MSDAKVGDPVKCGRCGAPAEYVAVGTFEQYEPSTIRYKPPGAAVPSLTGERLAVLLDQMQGATWLQSTLQKAEWLLPRLGGSVPEGPPPEGPWRIRPYPIMGKHSPMDGWWQVLRGGMHTGHPQPSGSFETHDEALAVRDALNSLAGAPRGLGRDPQ